MTTVTLWLLVSVGNGWFGPAGHPSALIDRFATAEDCESTRAQLFEGYSASKPRLQCVSAKVVR